MLVMSMLRMVGAARLRMSFGTGVWVILRNCAALRSSVWDADDIENLTFGKDFSFQYSAIFPKCREEPFHSPKNAKSLEKRTLFGKYAE